MRIVLASILAASALTLCAVPAIADDGEEGNRHYSDRGRHSDNDRGRDWRDNRHRHEGRRHHSDRYDNNRGRHYWGPSGRQWSRWDNSWGDPHRYARQWGFDRFDHNRGWHRGGQWYNNPSQWSDWGGWNWSFSVGNNGFNNGYNGFNNHSNHNGFGNANCGNYRNEEWVNGRRAIVTYVGCADRFGRVFEQQGTRRVERWVW